MAGLALHKTTVKPQSLLLRPAARRSMHVAAACNTERTIQKVAAGAALSAALMLGVAMPMPPPTLAAQLKWDLVANHDTDEELYTFEISCSGKALPEVNVAANAARQAAIAEPANAAMFSEMDKNFLLVTCKEPTISTTYKPSTTVAVESHLLVRSCPTWPCKWRKQ